MCFLLLLAGWAHAAPLGVELVQTEAGWSLHRDGAPYEVRGAGGVHALDTLADIGGNSIRTWGVGEETAELLDRAHEQGLSVSVGIWLGHDRHGFDYGNPAQVAEQLETARKAVMDLKDHPALLVWGVGNEMEGFEAGDDPQVWSAVCEVAAMVQELDPHHPVMTTTADIGGGRIAAVDACEHIDIHGVNAYGGANSVASRYQAGGGRKPLLLTEYGPAGTWETDPTDYGASQELSSSQKGEIYAQIWRQSLAKEPLFLGGYAFLWGWKTEATATWFGLFLPDGTRLGGVDALADAWGSPVADRAPVAPGLVLEGGDKVQPGSTVRVSWPVVDPEGGELETTWELRSEIQEQSTGGDAQGLPPRIQGAVLESSADTALLQMPETPGVLRLYAVARDAAGGGATASVPILVGSAEEARAATTPLPIWIYQDEGVGGPWVPSGHMGEPGAFEMDLGWQEGCASPPSCIRVETQANQWSGVAWQTPANNWGEVAGGVDLGDARWLHFKVRADFDWGAMTAGVGLVGPDKPNPDSLKVEKRIKLSSEWQDVRVRLRGDVSHVITGFWWVFGVQRAVTVYIDDVRLE